MNDQRLFYRCTLLVAVLCAWIPAAWADLLEMSTAEQQLLGIAVQTVAPAATGQAGELSLRVGFSPEGEWAIKTPLPGVLHRVWVQVGDRVEFSGEYEWNDQGGVVHWTHHDPRAQHRDGWLRRGSQTYQ